jgi:hypothetical protein
MGKRAHDCPSGRQGLTRRGKRHENRAVRFARACSCRRLVMAAVVVLLAGCGGVTKTTVSRTTKTTTVAATSSTLAPSGLPIHTLADFIRFPRRVRELFAIHYLTSHPDACYHGRPTPELVAANVAAALADYKPGYDSVTGRYVRAGVPIGPALEQAKAEIGC